MLFQTTQFLLFFLIFYSIYIFLPLRFQNVWIVLASAYFYGSWSMKFLALLFASAVLDFYLANKIYEASDKKNKFRYLLVSIVFNLGVLVCFKYYNFFIENFVELLGLFGLTANITLLNVILPLGISFYTFQTISYTADVYFEKIEAEKKFINYLLFIFFFPHLVAGPIMRADFLISQIKAKRNISFDKFLIGTKLFLWGVFKKVVIADNLAKLVDPVFTQTAWPSSAAIWIAIYAFSIQIYCDFSGYTDMARGVAISMGFNLPENFNWPYFSKSVTEFWRRWHISLSTWLKDYAYLPMAQKFTRYFRGKPVLSTCLALFITFTLCGLWHGAGWNYIIWGAYFGVLLAFSRYIKNKKTERYLLKLPTFLQVFFTFHIIAVGWLVFRSQSLGQTLELLQHMSFNWSFEQDLFSRIALLLSCAVVLFSFEWFQYKNNSQLLILPKSVTISTIIYVFIFYAIILIGSKNQVQFVYFQF